MNKPFYEIASVELLVPVNINCNLSLPNSDISHIKVFGYVNLIKGILYLEEPLPEGIDIDEFKESALHAIKNPPQPILPTVPEELYQKVKDVQEIKVPARAYEMDDQIDLTKEEDGGQ